MKLFIYDKFWDAFLKINKGTQSKVTDFISKFRTNSKSAALNLESINTFKDQTFRTARIDQKYRAILKEVTPGELYLLIWIDNHDEAMDWAKNKVINWNDQTQAYQVFSIDESIPENNTPINIPEGDLFMNKYKFNDLLEIGVPEVLIPSVLKISDFSALEKIESYLPVDVFENLFYLLDGADIDNLKTDIIEGTANDIQSKNNSRSFIELTDDEILNDALQGSLKKWKYYLHPSQSIFVYGKFNGSIKLSGAAGTGKTVAALHRLKYLAEHKNDKKPILFTTYTKELSENLIDLAADLEIPKNSYHITNIDSLAFDLSQKFGLRKTTDKVFGMNAVKSPQEVWGYVLDENLSNFDEDFLKKEYEEVILVQNISSKTEYLKASRIGRGKAISKSQRLDVWNLIEFFLEKKLASGFYYKEEIYNKVANHLKSQDLTVYSNIIVDELQDFTNVELNFIRALTPIAADDLFLVGDPLQNIYNRKINFSKAGINIRGNRSKRLRINYRTTEEIKRLAFSVVSNEHYDDFDGETEEKSGYLSLFHGVVPIYQLFTNKQSELDNVLQEINRLFDEGIRYNEIVIAARTKDSVNDFRNLLHKNNIPYIDKGLLNNKKEGVRLSTFHGLKGLEFKHVFLVDVNDRTFPKLPYNADTLDKIELDNLLKAEKSLFYVASSRAVQRLLISGVGLNSSLVKI